MQPGFLFSVQPQMLAFIFMIIVCWLAIEVAGVAANLGFVEAVSLLEDMVARNTATLLLLPAHMQAAMWN